MLPILHKLGPDHLCKFIKIVVGDNLLHAAEVGHGEPALSDADELVGGREVALLLRHPGGHVEAAEADAGQVFRLDLRRGDDT